MPDFRYTKSMAKVIDLANDDIRALLVMASSTAITDEDAEFLSDIGTLDECDGSGYARVALTTQSFDADLTNDRAIFTSDPLVFSAVGAASRQIFGYILYKHVGADSANIPIFWKQPSGFPFEADGEDITINPHATDGWAYLRNGTA